MKVAILALLCIASVFAGEYPTEDGVYVLTDKTFSEALGEFEYALVEFYAPWCGHCKSLAPHYAEAAQKLAETNPEIKLVKVDCTVEKDVAAKYEIKGFPTLKFFTKGSDTPIAYEGGRTTPDIISWLKKRTGPASVEAKSVEDAEKLVGDNEVVVFFFGPTDSDAHRSFISAAKTFDDVAFAHSEDQAVREKFSAAESSIVLFKKFDEGKAVFAESFGTDNIRNFINGNRFPTIFPFDQKAAQKIFGEGLDSIFLIKDDNEAGANAEAALRSVANEIKAKLTVSIAKIGENMGGRLAEYIGVTKDNLPAIRIVQPSKNNQKYLFENEITADNIKAFVADFNAGNLKSFFKSAPIPEEPLEENVRVVVGKNFQEVVIDNDNDVLMEYYAPWCGHCKSLAPIYSSLAAKLKDVQGITIGKMDATANEVEGLSVSGFPTIKFYPKGKKNAPVDYSGDRTEEGFIKYLKTHSSATIPEETVTLDEL